MKMSTLEKQFVNNAGHSQSVARKAEQMLRHVDVKQGQTYLDVGCGNGAAPIYVAQTFELDVTGVDVDPEQIVLAQKAAQGMPHMRFMHIDGRELPFDDGQFDLVFSNKVTHHIPNWLDALAEMVRVLKPGGYLLYSDLTVPALLARLGEAIVGNRVGFPNRPTIALFVLRQRLTTIYQSVHPLHFTGVFRKGMQ